MFKPNVRLACRQIQRRIVQANRAYRLHHQHVRPPALHREEAPLILDGRKSRNFETLRNFQTISVCDNFISRRGVAVKQVEEFLEHANECLSMAAKTTDEARKQKLIELASYWITLAGDRQKSLEQKVKQ